MFSKLIKDVVSGKKIDINEFISSSIEAVEDTMIPSGPIDLSAIVAYANRRRLVEEDGYIIVNNLYVESLLEKETQLTELYDFSSTIGGQFGINKYDVLMAIASYPAKTLAGVFMIVSALNQRHRMGSEYLTTHLTLPSEAMISTTQCLEGAVSKGMFTTRLISKYGNTMDDNYVSAIERAYIKNVINGQEQRDRLLNAVLAMSSLDVKNTDEDETEQLFRMVLKAWSHRNECRYLPFRFSDMIDLTTHIVGQVGNTSVLTPLNLKFINGFTVGTREYKTVKLLAPNMHDIYAEFAEEMGKNHVQN